MSKQAAQVIRKKMNLFLESIPDEDFPLWDLEEDPNAIALVNFVGALYAEEGRQPMRDRGSRIE